MQAAKINLRAQTGAPKWYNTFMNHLLTLGFQHSQAYPSLLTFQHNQSQIFLLVYVDDILVTGNNQEVINNILSKLHAQFNMQNLGTVHHFLGIKIQQFKDKFFLSQASYATSILTSANLTHCNPLANPSCTKLPPEVAEDTILSEPSTYRRITGSLQYLTLTRPDITYAVNVLSQHMHDPSSQHVYLLKRLLRYIRGTVDFRLPILKNQLKLTTYSDADWASDATTRKSTTGHCTFLGDTLISWAVKK
ncbi:uncharacterized protein LOC114579063 [Dendrobium catenatum]|uniref:uncharacterized protein LOC114579063 n=1 Tax=Dendrobium catenatum TaxID=906689 RepID=UPI0010A03322|nr:uncharacterized protein LOC114579063 [Dendrobium catenatum]